MNSKDADLFVTDAGTEVSVRASRDVSTDDLTIEISGVVDTSTAGQYTLTYSVTDDAGNTADATRTVNVAEAPDETPPEITVLGDNPLTWIAGEPYVDPGATALDDVDRGARAGGRAVRHAQVDDHGLGRADAGGSPPSFRRSCSGGSSLRATDRHPRRARPPAPSRGHPRSASVRSPPRR